MADPIAIIVVSPAVAFVRTLYANQQLRAFGCRVGFGRKILMAGAIVSLMLFEISSIVLIGTGGTVTSVWIFAVAMYLAYLASIVMALHSPRKEASLGQIQSPAERLS